MKRLFAATSAVTMLAALPVLAQGTMGAAPSANPSSGATSVSDKDRDFIKEAASGGMAEVKLGQLAQEKASDTGVRNFGRRMVDDHQAADARLKQVADKVGVAVPSTIDKKDQATYDRLSKLNGPAFDRAYMQEMVADHRKDIGDFQKEANAAKNPDLRNFVQQTTPTLQQHLAMAQQVQESLVASGSSKAKDQRHAGHDATKHADRRGTGSSDNATTQQLNRAEANRLQQRSSQ
jgi:putative membrane protein